MSKAANRHNCIYATTVSLCDGSYLNGNDDCLSVNIEANVSVREMSV